MMLNDQKLYPVQCCNHRGQLVFSQHQAQNYLQEDVKAKKHQTMTQSELHTSCLEYKEFDCKLFGCCVNPEI
eukprot:10808481-Ditylum_brightwellii.AAC.1